MREVTKSEFKRIYFEVGGCRDGWDAAHWKRTFEDNPRPGITMWIVSDFAVNEYRLFFRTAEHSDDMLVFPDTEE